MKAQILQHKPKQEALRLRLNRLGYYPRIVAKTRSLNRTVKDAA